MSVKQIVLNTIEFDFKLNNLSDSKLTDKTPYQKKMFSVKYANLI